jgi:glycosyltransferase involved in cell wall biosynthesis
MKISVALCTYNGQKFISEQLNSILGQTYPVNEIIICDDGSSDNTIGILKEFQVRYPNIIKLFINYINIGGKKNFEKAFSLTTGDLIFFSDQDDVWEKNKVEIIVKTFAMFPDRLGVFSDAYLINETGEKFSYSFLDSLAFTEMERGLINEKDIHNYILKFGNMVAGSMLAVKKESKKYVLPFQLMDVMWHDHWIALALSVESKLSFIDKKLINYRIHNLQQIGAGSEKNIEKVNRIKFFGVTANQLEYPLEYFNYCWHTYNRISSYKKNIKNLEPLIHDLRNNALQAKAILLSNQSFWVRKAKLLKWFINRQFETTFIEILGINNF